MLVRIGIAANMQGVSASTLLKEVATTNPYAVICTYEDRIARFGTKVINHFYQTFDTKVISLYQPQTQGAERKLV